MLRLLLLRHSKATAHVADGDLGRALNRRGAKDARRIGEYLRAEELRPDLALVSPARRTRETLERVLKGLARAVAVTREDKLYLASPHILLGVVRDAPGEVRTLLVVGHNPGLAELAGALVRSGEPRALAAMGASFPTSALAVVDFEAKKWAEVDFGQGRLDRFVTPASLDGRENA